MRLKSITIEGFRAFGRQTTIDLDADVILLQGPNGVGKTSLLDAILWALAGTIDRFVGRGSPISIYAQEGTARVELTMAGERGDVVVTRATDGDKPFVRLRVNGEEFEQAAAEQELCNLLLPHLKDRSGASEALNRVLTRGVYLQQDLVRQFIDDDSASDRFALVSEVIGAGAVLDLQAALEKSRRAWAVSTNAFRKEELEPAMVRRAQIDEHLLRLSDDASIESADARAASEQLFQNAVSLLGQSRLGGEAVPTTPGRLDRFLKTLDSERGRLERELVVARSLREQIPELTAAPAVEAKEEQLREAEVNLAREIREADDALREENERLASEREAQVAASDRTQRLATLARLAMQGLDDHCPVCEQLHNVHHTTAHLQALIQAASESSPAIHTDKLRPLLIQRSDLQRVIEKIRADIRQIENERREAEARRTVVAARLSDMAIEATDDAAERLREREESAKSTLLGLSRLIADGERLSLQVLRLGEQRQREDLGLEKSQLEQRLRDATARVAAEEGTHALAGRIIEGLRDASLAVTDKQIDEIGPLFQRIYSRIDPHPTFRVTQIVAGMDRGRGKLDVGISDPEATIKARDAGPLLSSSQLNSFAVSLFLAMNLALPNLRLRVTVLDDPLQSLDSVNLLGLVDVLRRFRAHRQIVVSTHEERLVGLLQRKLRPVRSGERMVTIVFEDWSREGPTMRIVEARPGAEEEVIAA